MLVLSRKPDQSLVLGDDIVITVLAIEGDRVKIGIQAPRSLTVLRQEVYEQVKEANASAALSGQKVGVASVAALLRDRRTSTAPQTFGTGE